jgi:hypothetical protein
VTSQDPPASVQLAGENDPLASEENATAPVGVVGVPEPVSVTVAVHVVGASTATANGTHCSAVAVLEAGAPAAGAATLTAAVAWLGWWVGSPS